MIRIKTTDGQDIAFEPKYFAQGGMKNVHWVEGRHAVVGFYRTPPNQQGMDRLRAIIGPHRKSILEGAGGETLSRLYRWPEAIIDWNGTIGAVVPVFEEQFFRSWVL